MRQPPARDLACELLALPTLDGEFALALLPWAGAAPCLMRTILDVRCFEVDQPSSCARPELLGLEPGTNVPVVE